MSSVRRCSFLVAAALAVAAPLSAQWKPVADAGWMPSPVASPAAATVPESTMPKASASAFVAPPLPGQEPRTSRDVALMIVGGTALITGAIIGDDAGGVLMVGGTVVGLVGLYQYLR